MHGEIPVVPAAAESLAEIAALWLPPLPGQGISRPGPAVTWIHKVREIQAIHTHSKQHTHSCSSKCQLGECQVERGGCYLHLGQEEEAGHGQL